MLRILAPTRTVFAALTGGLLLAFACALLLVPLTSGPASAATLEQKQAAARDRIQQTSKAIEAGRSDLEAAQSEAADAAARESDLTGLLANGEERSANSYILSKFSMPLPARVGVGDCETELIRIPRVASRLP